MGVFRVRQREPSQLEDGRVLVSTDMIPHCRSLCAIITWSFTFLADSTVDGSLGFSALTRLVLSFFVYISLSLYFRLSHVPIGLTMAPGVEGAGQQHVAG